MTHSSLPHGEETRTHHVLVEQPTDSASPPPPSHTLTFKLPSQTKSSLQQPRRRLMVSIARCTLPLEYIISFCGAPSTCPRTRRPTVARQILPAFRPEEDLLIPLDAFTLLHEGSRTNMLEQHDAHTVIGKTEMRRCVYPVL